VLLPETAALALDDALATADEMTLLADALALADALP
jgi:hypothetical protein